MLREGEKLNNRAEGVEVDRARRKCRNEMHEDLGAPLVGHEHL